MGDQPYIDYNKDEMILRDFLALHRSQMANERTLLGYVRTSLAISAGGLTLVKLFQEWVYQVVGWVLVPTGGLLLLWGIYRYISNRSNFDDLDRQKS